MNYNKKAILVPYDKYQRLIKNEEQNIGQSADQHDTVMTTEPANKVTETEKDIKDTSMNESDVDQETSHDLTKRVLQELPENKRDNSVVLLNTLPLTWDKDGQIILPNGRVIPHTNIIDWFKYMQLSDSEKPEGSHELLIILSESNLPLKLIGNEHVKRMVKHLRSAHIPVKQKVKVIKTKPKKERSHSIGEKVSKHRQDKKFKWQHL